MLRFPKIVRSFLYILYLAIAVSFILGILEVILRQTGYAPPQTTRPHLAGKFDKFHPDRHLIWRLKTNWDGYEVNGAPVQTNRFGFRGKELAPRSEVDYRVHFLGDSVTFGHFLQEPQTVPFFLEDALRANTKKKIEVINGGVPGYSTFQEIVQFEQHAKLLMPDLVVLGFCLNDVTERYHSLMQFGGNRFFMINVDTSVGINIIQRLWSHSAIRQFIIQNLGAYARRKELYQVRALWETPDAPHIQLAMTQVLEELDTLIDTVRQHNVDLAVVLYPYAIQTQTGLNLPQQQLLAHLRKREVAVLDLLPVLSQSAEPLFLDANHFSPLGSHKAALNISQFLLDNFITF